MSEEEWKHLEDRLDKWDAVFRRGSVVLVGAAISFGIAWGGLTFMVYQHSKELTALQAEIATPHFTWNDYDRVLKSRDAMLALQFGGLREGQAANAAALKRMGDQLDALALRINGGGG